MTITSKGKADPGSAQAARFATVLVGSDKKSFVVHQDLLTYHSRFFKAALTGNFKEAGDKTVTLKEEDPLIFEFFVHWLYHKGFPAKHNTSVELLNDWERENDHGGAKTGNLIHLYILGDQYGVPELGLLALTELFQHMEEMETGLPNRLQIIHAFNSLPDGSALLLYLIDSHCHYSGGYFWDNENVHDFPSAFLIGILKRYSQYAQGGRSSSEELNLCDYHDHKEDKEGSSCPFKEIITLL
ncbi:uncharacterized protein EKO05_0007522 [Ascochyta rabiei]|uniref:Uncharacterized protein n=1 Tax=Didymella rabiei TaxID=5454 RepID=A0A162YKA5_DIDRA|nr:uncharacterized protein EKO05_0007522 [Ascochyta rabiei]KZM20094.1 hypothetical protein ST47_g8780 [Ascochyta rabiei]UPX17148.1 hypothetical protein EKO05_0007522 [Ascochyta rabiei]